MPAATTTRLRDRWVLWQDKWDTRTDTRQNIQQLKDMGESDSAAGFWQLFNAHPIERLQEGVSVHYFKGSVKPEWEDPANINGGHFRITPLPGVTPGKLWYNLVSAAIGNQFTLSSAVVGIGFSLKTGQRKVIALWISTSDPAAVRTMHDELRAQTGDSFTVKFVEHKTLHRGDFTAQQSVWHRRTKSAPSQAPNKHISIDTDDDTESPEPTEASGMKRRVAPGPLTISPEPGHEHTTSPQHQLTVPVGPHEHTRSKSDSNRDTIPIVQSLNKPNPAVPRASPPPSLAAPNASSGSGPQHQHSEHDFSWTDSSTRELRDSNSGVYPTVKAPTPMKEWADQWSPSLFHAAMQNRGALLPAECASSSTSPGQGQAEIKSTAQLLHLAHVNAQADEPSPMNMSETQPMHAMLAALSGRSPNMSAAQDPSPPATTVQVPPRPMQHHQHHQPLPQQQQYVPHPYGTAPALSVCVPAIPPHMSHNPYLPQARVGLPPVAYSGVAVPPPSGAGYRGPFAGQQINQSVEINQPLPPYVIVRAPVTHTNPDAAPVDGGKPPRGKAGATHESTHPKVLARAAASPPPTVSTPQQVQGESQPAAAAPPKSGGGDERHHTKSDACAFVMKGWKYPAGLNRKERRRIMFSDEVVPSEYPGAVFVGLSVPDGPADE